MSSVTFHDSASGGRLSDAAELEARKALGERLKRARLESGSRANPIREVSKAWVGRQIGVTGVAVGLWESGANEPNRATLERLADLYGVELLWLTFGRGPQWPENPRAVPPTEVLPHGAQYASDVSGARQITPEEARRVDEAAAAKKARRRNGKA